MRALVAATVATGVALGSHVLGGGFAPSLTGLLVPFALSLIVCWHLGNRMNSWWRTALGVTASQALFHSLFVVGSGGAMSSSSGHAHHVAPGDLVVAAGQVSAHGAHGGVAMTVAHIAAGVVTTALLARLDWALARALDAMRALLAPVHRLTEPIVVPRRPGRVVASPHPALAPCTSPVTSGRGLRGPPVSVSLAG